MEHVLIGRKVLSLNFDVEIDKQRFLAAASLSPKDALQSLGNPEFLVVDEAQRLPDTGRIVKGWYDARLPVKILLLGSSSLELLNRAAETFSTNPRKEIAKSRKIYFWDTGIRNALLDAFSTSDLRPDIGALWENWVIAEVAKRNALSGGASATFSISSGRPSIRVMISSMS